MSLHVYARRFFDFDEAVAIDCEMVGGGPRGEIAILGRVSIVDEYGNILLDEYVKPTQPVTCYRTRYSGIRRRNLENGWDYNIIRNTIIDICENRLIVGHCLIHDLRVLNLQFDKRQIYDTQNCPLIKRAFYLPDKPSLKYLSQIVLNRNIQVGEHCSVEDASATMRVYNEIRDLYMEGYFG